VPAEDDVGHRSFRVEHGLALLALTGLVGLTGGAIAACAGAPPQDDLAALAATVPVPTASADPDGKWNDKASAKGSSSPKDDDLNDAQKEQMEIALRRGGDKAGNCGSVVPDAARGEAEVKVTFDGKKGRAVDVAVGPPWAGTDAEGCIKRAFIGEIIVPFDGQLEVPYTVKIGAKGDAAKGKDAKGKGPKKSP
jgi:hypothetical protein